MNYVNSLISEWMPGREKRVAVDSHPRLSEIMDTINSTLAHSVKTRLPAKFYDRRGQEIMEKIVMEEWFSGFKESREYRQLGAGSLMGDIVARMVGNAESKMSEGRFKTQGELNGVGTRENGEHAIKFAMSGCHDSTLAAILSSLGAFEGERWPPYTSHIAIELFSNKKASDEPVEGKILHGEPRPRGKEDSHGPTRSNVILHNGMAPKKIARRNIDALKPAEKCNLDGFYVRIRYNDRPIVVPGCKLPGKHLRDDESFCTLVRVQNLPEFDHRLTVFRRPSSPSLTTLPPEVGRRHVYQI